MEQAEQRKTYQKDRTKTRDGKNKTSVQYDKAVIKKHQKSLLKNS